MNTYVWRDEASANNNGDFISIHAYSGYSLAMLDPTATEQLLPPDAPDETLGHAVIEALNQSRFLPLDEARALSLNTEKNYLDWVQKLMNRYGYKTKRALFKKMRNCDIERQNGIITIGHSHHEKLESWSGDGINPDDYVKIPADSPPAEIGKALRLAFSRCTGMGTFEP